MADKQSMDDELLAKLEQEYETTKVISIVCREGRPPKVESPNDLPESEVISTLLKTLLFLCVDELIYDIIDEVFDEDDEESGDGEA